MANAPLQPAYVKLAEAAALFKQASRGGVYTDRSDPRVHRGQELTMEAIRIADSLGVAELRLYQLARERNAT